MALTQCLCHLLTQQSSLSMSLYNQFEAGWYHVDTYLNTASSTNLHCHGVQLMASNYLTFLCACSICTSGVLSLLCAKINPDIIHLLGHWWSNEMLHHLHVQAFPLVAPLAEQGYNMVLTLFCPINKRNRNNRWT